MPEGVNLDPLRLGIRCSDAGIATRSYVTCHYNSQKSWSLSVDHCVGNSYFSRLDQYTLSSQGIHFL